MIEIGDCLKNKKAYNNNNNIHSNRNNVKHSQHHLCVCVCVFNPFDTWQYGYI